MKQKSSLRSLILADQPVGRQVHADFRRWSRHKICENLRHLRATFSFVFFIYSTLPASPATIDTFSVFSNSMQKEIKNIVVLPDDYNSGEQEFPVLYLLHGAGGSCFDWITFVPELEDYADQHNMIITCPDGGFTSWYFDSPIDPKMLYETYVSKELINEIDKQYRTIEETKGRAITGLSMGGHGALYLAFRHHEIYGAGGSTSGGLDIRPFPKNWDIAKRLGNYKDHKSNWENNTVTNMIGLLEGSRLAIIFDCGVDDFFYDVNLEFHKKLLQAKIDHDYIERPGGHTADYWKNAIKYQILFFSEFFELNQ